LGTGHVTGTGEPMRPVDRFQYECFDCNKTFWIKEKMT
jgi:hypothetical protein